MSLEENIYKTVFQCDQVPWQSNKCSNCLLDEFVRLYVQRCICHLRGGKTRPYLLPKEMFIVTNNNSVRAGKISFFFSLLKSDFVPGRLCSLIFILKKYVLLERDQNNEK